MIKKLYDRCVAWAGHKYAKPILALEAFIESSFFPIPPDVMIVPMVIAKRKEFIQIAVIATIFSLLGALFGYYIGYSLNEVAIKIFEFYGYEYSDSFKERFATGGGFFAWLGILITAGFTPLPFKLLTISSGFIHFNLLFFIIFVIKVSKKSSIILDDRFFEKPKFLNILFDRSLRVKFLLFIN